MRMTINCDMGEGFGLYRLGNDAALMPHIDLANVACGFHASDPSIMHETVRLAKEHGVKVGAHPSLPDMQGFGRRAPCGLMWLSGGMPSLSRKPFNAPV